MKQNNRTKSKFEEKIEQKLELEKTKHQFEKNKFEKTNLGGQKMEEKPKRTKILLILTIVFAVLFIAAIGFIVLERYQVAQLQSQIDAYQQGAQLGYQEAVKQLMQQVATCSPQGVPVTYGNMTAHVVALECYAQQQTPK